MGGRGILRRPLLWASENRWLNEHLPRYPCVRRAVSRFMPGEDTAAALEATEALARSGVGAVLTILGENVTRSSEAETTVREYVELLEQIDRRGLDAEISVKL